MTPFSARSHRQQFEAAETAVLAGRPSTLDPLRDKPLLNPWQFPGSFAAFFYPDSARRNFFLIHEHAATAYHWDLRLQCALVHGDSGTLSWAIPRGFHKWDNLGEKRIAIQTPLHPVWYTYFEGVSSAFGSTLISDFGTYSVQTSLTDIKRGRDRAQETPDSDEEQGNEESIGAGEERALADAFKRRAIVIELRGIRFNIRLSLNHQDVKATGTGMRRQWMTQLAPDKQGSRLYKDRRPEWTGRSILTGRMMSEVAAQGGSVYPRETTDVTAEDLGEIAASAFIARHKQGIDV